MFVYTFKYFLFMYDETAALKFNMSPLSYGMATIYYKDMIFFFPASLHDQELTYNSALKRLTF